MIERRQFHQRPKTAPLNEELRDILVPALSKLRQCATALDAALLVETVPRDLLPEAVWEASRRPYYPSVAVAALVKACGWGLLEKRLGLARARTLYARYR